MVYEISKIVSKKLSKPSGLVAMMAMKKERAAVILERETESTIQNWMSRMEQSSELGVVSLGHGERTGHLHLLMSDLVVRLRCASAAESSPSVPARDHGILRYEQGYSSPMMVEESRLLQGSIFNTLPGWDLETNHGPAGQGLDLSRRAWNGSGRAQACYAAQQAFYRPNAVR